MNHRAYRALTAAGALMLVAGLAIGCDDSGRRPHAAAATTESTTETAMSTVDMAATQPIDASALRPLTDAATRPISEVRQRIPLVAAPLTVQVPQSWSVQSADTAGGKLILAGKLPSNATTEILISKRPDISAEAFTSLANDVKGGTTEPADQGTDRHVRVGERDGLRFIEEVERIGPAGTDPNMVPYRWTVKYVVPSGGINFNVYELNVVDISQATFKTDESFLRQVFDSVQIDPTQAAASQPVMR